ncbi:MAG: hypothetical protein C5B60_02420 [Chloroflexi bacterium]|nr:MAG: hypothetical protein C5B60_02420 [Chloroflexota bacterium]
MVDRTNLQQVNLLYAEARSIANALQAFDNGGVIVQMSVSTGPLIEPIADERFRQNIPMSIIGGIPVDTRHIAYPPEMVGAIRAALQARYGEINGQLQQMGLTGV